MTPTASPTMTPSEALSQWTDQVGSAMRDWWDGSSQAWEPLWQAWAQPMQSLASFTGTAPGTAHSHEHHGRHGHDHAHDHGKTHGKGHQHHGDGCGCGCSGSTHERSCCDPCACCIPDADVVVHTRVGERRVVPFELGNERHRDREVTLAVGDWVACDGPALEVKAVLEPSGAVTLAPCERLTVRLLVAVAAAPPATPPDPATGNDQPPAREGLVDVDACSTTYADVRFEGCARPVRVALVVHPAACDALPVDCDCGCCC